MSVKVTVYNSVGQNKKVFETEAETFGELQADLDANDVTWVGMQAMVGETENALATVNSTLPKDDNGDFMDFTLILLPKKVKSGGNEEVAELLRDAVDAITEALAILENDADGTFSITDLKEIAKRIEENLV